MMRTLANIICVAAIVGLGSANKSNYFMDYLLRLVRSEARQNKLDAVPVPDFNITVDSNRFTNRPLRAKFVNGFVRRLNNVVRQSECERSRWLYGNITLGCTLDISMVLVTYSVAAQGHSVNPQTDWMDVYGKVETGTIKLEVHSLPNKPAHVKTFSINRPLLLTLKRVSRTSRIYLNEGRTADFNRQTIRHMTQVLEDTIMSTYLTVLAEIMIKYSNVLVIPPVE